MRCVVNLTFDDFTVGEIVDVDPTLWREYVDSGFLTEVDEDGDRIVPLATDDGDAPFDQTASIVE